MQYLIVVPVPAYEVSPRQFAIESAFGFHLRMLKSLHSPPFNRLVLAAPQMSEGAYQCAKEGLIHIDTDEEGIVFSPLFDGEMGRLRFAFTAYLPVIFKSFHWFDNLTLSTLDLPTTSTDRMR